LPLFPGILSWKSIALLPLPVNKRLSTRKTKR
jgi:hypothetical protein